MVSSVDELTFEIWCEGNDQSVHSLGAQLMARNVKARTFQEACDIHFKGNKLYHSQELTYYGSKLFDNEEDARKYNG